MEKRTEYLLLHSMPGNDYYTIHDLKLKFKYCYERLKMREQSTFLR